MRRPLMRKVVIGLGYGDEGKGKVVSALSCPDDQNLVVRFCGGHQAGHHVVRKDMEHIFSNYGSATLQGGSTYWSRPCTFDPIGVLNERAVLASKGIKDPLLWVNWKCPITTPYDKIANRADDALNKHGSVGVGVGRTLQREEDRYSFTVEDLSFPSVMREKIKLIGKYYGFSEKDTWLVGNHSIPDFIKACEEVIEVFQVATDLAPSQYLKIRKDRRIEIIYEGSQGLMLSQNIGFFPHVTRGYTDLTNIHEPVENLDIYLVTRAYQTRHGAGPLTNEDLPHAIAENPYENNFDHTFQGKFRKAILDLDIIIYALHKSRINIHASNLVITCLDCLEEYSLTHNGRREDFISAGSFIGYIDGVLRPKKIYISDTPYPELTAFK